MTKRKDVAAGKYSEVVEWSPTKADYNKCKSQLSHANAKLY
jgi:hypothetical protein